MTVVDASVAIKWFVDEPDADAARKILESEQDFFAPAHMLAETARGLLRRKRAGDLAAGDARSALAGLPLMVSLEPIGDLASDAFDIADRSSVTIYDAFYVALAERLECVLVTADKRLCEGLSSTPWAGRAQRLLERAALMGPKSRG